MSEPAPPNGRTLIRPSEGTAPGIAPASVSGDAGAFSDEDLFECCAPKWLTAEGENY